MIEGDSTGEEGSSETASSPGQPLMKATTLEPGTPLRVRTTNALSTASVKTGEAFAATLQEPIVDGTWVIATKGSSVRGVIAHADPGGKVKGVAGLSVRLTQIQTADGQNIDISTNTYGVQARSSKKKDAKKVGIASGVGAAIGAIVGGGKGAAIGAGAGGGRGYGGGRNDPWRSSRHRQRVGIDVRVNRSGQDSEELARQCAGVSRHKARRDTRPDVIREDTIQRLALAILVASSSMFVDPSRRRWPSGKSNTVRQSSSPCRNIAATFRPFGLPLLGHLLAAPQALLFVVSSEHRSPAGPSR